MNDDEHWWWSMWLSYALAQAEWAWDFSDSIDIMCELPNLLLELQEEIECNPLWYADMKVHTTSGTIDGSEVAFTWNIES